MRMRMAHERAVHVEQRDTAESTIRNPEGRRHCGAVIRLELEDKLLLPAFIFGQSGGERNGSPRLGSSQRHRYGPRTQV
jgi:hypothetical protein